MKTSKKILSLMLSIIMILGTVVVGFNGFDSTNFAKKLSGLFANKAEAATTAAKVYVPDTIYLSPATSATTSQYYLNNTLDENDNVVAESGYSTSGKIYLSVPGAKKWRAKLEGVAENNSFHDFELCGSGFANNGGYGTIDFGVSSTGKNYPIVLSSGLAAGSTRQLKWTIQYTFDDVSWDNNDATANSQFDSCTYYTTYAYTTVYAPYTGSSAAHGYADTQKSAGWMHSSNRTYATFWVSGVHSVSGGSNAYKFAPFTGNDLSNTDSVTMTGIGLGEDYDKDGGEDVHAKPIGGTATLYVDTSRYTNYSQIPNLRVGLDINNRNSADRAEYNFVTFDGTDLYREKLTVGGGGTRIYDSYDSSNASSKINVAIGTTSKTVLAVGEAKTAKNGNGDNYCTQTITGTVPINLVCVDKSDLRDAVQEAISLEGGLSDDKLAALDSAVASASNVLGNPVATSQEIFNSTSAVETAIVSASQGEHVHPTEEFLAPELIYLNPSDEKTFQYFVNDCIYSDSSYEAELEASATAGTGYLTFTGPAGSTVTKLTCTGATINGKSAGSDITSGFKKSGNTVQGSITASTSSLSSTATESSTTIKWTVTYTLVVNDKTLTETATAYTECYAPYKSPVGAAGIYTSNSITSRSISWWSGIHSMGDLPTMASTAATPTKYAANSSGTYALAPILGSVTYPSNNAEVTSWLNQTSGNDMTINYLSGSASSASDEWRTTAVTANKSILHIDTSRITNLSQVPNLTAGTLNTSNYGNDANKRHETGTDITTKTAFYNETHGASDTWHDTVRDGISTSNDDNPRRIIRNGSVSYEITKLSTNTVNIAYRSCLDMGRNPLWSGSWASVILKCPLQIVCSDKTSLRTAYQNAIQSGRQASMYTTSSWNTYEDALKAVAKNLERVDVAANASLVTDLNTAIGGLVLKDTTITRNYISTDETGVTIYDQKTTTVPFGNDIHFSTPAIPDGYSYSGYTVKYNGGSESDLNTSEDFSEIYTMHDSIELTYKYSANTYKVGFDNEFFMSEHSFSEQNGNKITINFTSAQNGTDDKGNPKYTTEATSEDSVLTSVMPGKTYLVGADVDFTAGNGGREPKGQIYLFFYDNDGKAITPNHTDASKQSVLCDGKTATDKTPSFSGDGYHYVTYIIPEGCYKVKIRFDCDISGATVGNSGTAEYSNVRFVEWDDSMKDVSYPSTEQNVTYDSAYGTLPTPTKTGYAFDGWFTASSGGTKVESTITVTRAENHTLYSKWTAIAVDDTFIMDFGTAATLDVTSNDYNAAKYPAFSVSAVTDMDGNDFSGATVNCTNGVVTFKPNAIISQKLKFTYTTIPVNGEYGEATVTIIPANNVYYEEDFVTFEDTYSTNKWSKLTDNSSAVVAAKRAEESGVYGYDSGIYGSNSTAYSLNTHRELTVTKENTADNWGAYAEFTFTGTGFDVYSVTSCNAGYFAVRIKKDGTPDKNNADYKYSYNAYTGYRYENNQWIADNTKDKAIYQAPIISKLGLEHGTYTVRIYPLYSAMNDVGSRGQYTFYLDAIRIYNPMGTNITDDTVNAAYNEAGENDAKYLSIRNAIIAAEKAKGAGKEGVPGVSFFSTDVSAKTMTFGDYVSIGSKEDVFLAHNQGVSFGIKYSNGKPANVAVGVRKLEADNKAATVKVIIGNTTKTITVNSTTDIFRNIVNSTELSSYADTTDTIPVTITNISGDSGVNISITKLKVTYASSSEDHDIDPVRAETSAPARSMVGDGEATERTVELVFNSELFRSAVEQFFKEKPTIDVSEVSVEWEKTSVELGDPARLFITAPEKVTKVTVDGSEVAGYETLSDGSKKWTFVTYGEGLGNKEFNVVAFVPDGEGDFIQSQSIGTGVVTFVKPVIDIKDAGIEFENDEIKLNETTTLNIETSTKVAAVYVGDTRYTDFDLKDGKRVFTVDITPTKTGKNDFVIKLESITGDITETITKSITVTEYVVDSKGVTVKWSAGTIKQYESAILTVKTGENIVKVEADGKAMKLVKTENGEKTWEITYTEDKPGTKEVNIKLTDENEMKSENIKSGKLTIRKLTFWERIVRFFKKLFGLI